MAGFIIPVGKGYYCSVGWKWQKTGQNTGPTNCNFGVATTAVVLERGWMVKRVVAAAGVGVIHSSRY